MGTIDAEYERLGFLRRQGRGQERVHVAFIEEEAKARVENLGSKPKTRFVFELDSPEMYSRYNELKDKWLRILNKSVAVSLLADRWDLEEQEIRELGEDQ